jgi:hypothetical protein
MIVVNNVAHCRNGACKNFGKEFVAPSLELHEVAAPEPSPAAVTEPEPELPPAA